MRPRMRPKMRPGMTTVMTESGLFVRCGERELFVRGQAARAWFDRLRTALDGTREVGEVEAGLGPGLTTAFPGVLKKLVEMDLVYDAAEDMDLPARVVDLYSSSLVQLWDRCRRPNESFWRYREGTLVVAGSPEVASVVLRVSAERGLGSALVLAEEDAELDSLQRDVADLESGPLDVRVSFPTQLGEVTGVAGVLYASRVGYHGEESRELMRYCQDRRIPFLTAGRIGETLYIGPLSNVPGATCVACAATCLDAAGNGDDRSSSSRDQLYVTVMGGLMASWWFSYRTGLGTSIFGRDIVSVNCSSFATTGHVVTRRPDCPVCAGRSKASALVGQRERRSAGSVTDAVFGWFASSSGDELSQVPLGQYEVVVNNRSEVLGEDRPRVRVSAVSSDGLKERASALGASLYLRSVDTVADPIIWESLGNGGEPRSADRPFEVIQVVADSAPSAVGMGLCGLALAHVSVTDIDVAGRMPLAKSIRSGEFGLTDELLELVKFCGIFAIGDVLVRKWRPSLPLSAWIVRAECAASTATVVDIDESRALSRCLSELLSSRTGPGVDGCHRPSELLALGLANDLFGTAAEWQEWLGPAEMRLTESGFRIASGHGPASDPLTRLGLSSFHVGLCRESPSES